MVCVCVCALHNTFDDGLVHFMVIDVIIFNTVFEQRIAQSFGWHMFVYAQVIAD